MPHFDIQRILLLVPVALLALTVHEYSHGLVADKLGDNTARLQGRLTLNPLAHLDIIGTILIFLVGFGWAKPVPVNMRNLKDPQRDMMLIALAGPASNLLMALIAGMVLRSWHPDFSSNAAPLMIIVLQLLKLSIVINVALAVFNMIPLPPLDGSRVVYGLLPYDKAITYSKIEPYGVMILFGLFFFGGQVFSSVLWYPISFIIGIITGSSI